jgi:UDP-glucuronate decarboxylase
MVRPFNIYGPGMQETDYRVLPNFASRIKGNKPLHIYGSGNQTRTFCYITDAIAGFLKVLVHGVPGEPYNIGNPKPEISMLHLAREIGKVLGRSLEIATITYPDSYPADEPNRRCPDIRKASLQLDFRPRVALKEGLKRFLAWSNSVYTGEQ